MSSSPISAEIPQTNFSVCLALDLQTAIVLRPCFPAPPPSLAYTEDICIMEELDGVAAKTCLFQSRLWLLFSLSHPLLPHRSSLSGQQYTWPLLGASPVSPSDSTPSILLMKQQDVPSSGGNDH